MPDYKQGKIYKMTCETGKVYIGSTVSSLNRRLAQHKTNHNVCVTKDFINPKIELIESYPCETKPQLLWRERELIEKTDCVNKYKPIRADLEREERAKEYKTLYYQENKERAKEYKTLYYQENKERAKAYSVVYRQENKERINQKFNCECGGKFTNDHKARHLKTKKHQAFVSSVKINL